MKEYFSHDYHAREDEKVINLIKQEGFEGYGLYWAIIEMLYESDGFLAENYENLAFALRTDCERITRVIKNYRLFVLASKKIHSKSCLARLIARKGKSEKARQSAIFRWSKLKSNDANAMRTQCDSNAIKEKKRKVNKRKEKDIAEASSAENFSSNDYIQELLRSKKRHLNIIGKYFFEKNPVWPSKKAANAEMLRWAKIASALAEYPDERIDAVYSLIVSDAFLKDKWTLQTIFNKISTA
jgi:uncharacterized protein YdaU (DUF1376 family)